MHQIYGGLAEGIVYVAVVAHFLFIGYLVAGGFLAWRYPRTLWLHLVTAAWAVAITVIPVLECPLTLLERWGRTRAGMAPLPGDGFIAHYITGVFYPESAKNAVEVAVAVLVAVSWAGYAARRRSRRHAAPYTRADVHSLAALHSGDPGRSGEYAQDCFDRPRDTQHEGPSPRADGKEQPKASGS